MSTARASQFRKLFYASISTLCPFQRPSTLVPPSPPLLTPSSHPLFASPLPTPSSYPLFSPSPEPNLNFPHNAPTPPKPSLVPFLTPSSHPVVSPPLLTSLPHPLPHLRYQMNARRARLATAHTELFRMRSHLVRVRRILVLIQRREKLKRHVAAMNQVIPAAPRSHTDTHIQKPVCTL